MSKGYKEVKPCIDFSAISAANKNLSDIMKIQQEGQKQNISKETTKEDDVVQKFTFIKAEQQPVKKQIIIEEPEEYVPETYEIPPKSSPVVNIQKEYQNNPVQQIPVQLKHQSSQHIIKQEKYQNQSPVLQTENKAQQISNSIHKEMESKLPSTAPEYKVTHFQLKEENTPQLKKYQRNDEQIFQTELYNKLILYLEEEGLNELLMELRNTDQKICITVILDYVLNQLEVAKEQEVYLKQHIKENYQTIADLQQKLYDSNERIEAIAAKSENLKLSKLSQESNQQALERQQKIDITKYQNNQLNKKWSSFCEQLLQDRNILISKQLKIIENLNIESQELYAIIDEIISKFPLSIQEKWCNIIKIKYEIISKKKKQNESQNNFEKETLENDIQMLHQQCQFSLQSIMSLQDQLSVINLSVEQRKTFQQEQEIFRLKLHIHSLENMLQFQQQYK